MYSAPGHHGAHPGVSQAAPPGSAAPGAEAAAEAALPADAPRGRGEAAGGNPQQPDGDLPQQVRRAPTGCGVRLR